MRKALAAVAIVTLTAGCWILFILTAVQHQGFHRETFVALGLIAQSAVTLFALGQLRRPTGLASVLHLVLTPGALWMFFAGQKIVARQLSRSPVDALNRAAPHFEGYALVIAVLLMVQAILTLFTILGKFVFPRSTSQSLA